MIPKTIHYCWFGNTPIPTALKKCIKSWKKYCPDYNIIKWDESNFDINCNKFVKKAYEEKCWAFVSDYARLKIIYENGGIYLDTDVELVKNLDDLLKEDVYFGTQQIGKNIGTGLGFGARKNSKILKEMMQVYENLEFDAKNKNNLSCPILNTEVLSKYGFHFSNDIVKINSIDTVIYPPKYFDPISPGDSQYLLCEDTYSIHRYSASWTSGFKRIKRKISNIIGQRNINKLKKMLLIFKNNNN